MKALLLPCAVLVWLCVAFYLPGLLALPPVDRDEPRFAQATRQMLESGDFVRPRFQAEPLYEKPIGIYWLQAAAVAAIGSRDAIWPYRVPSMLGAILAVLGTFVIGARRSDRQTGFLAAALLAASPVLVVEADLATTDAMLLACVVLSQGCLAEIYLADARGTRPGPLPVIGLWAGLGVGILIKGPIAPTVSLLTVLALRFSKRRVRLTGLRIGWGLPIVAVIVAPWALTVGTATGWTFYGDALRNDILPKLIGGQESHGAPPGYYLVLCAATFWPGSMVTLPAVRAALHERDDPWVRFALAWLVPTWLLFEVIPTKLPHYILPTYPALALLCARVARTHDRRNPRAMWIAVLGTGLLLASTLGFVLPRIEPLWPTVRAARAVADRTLSTKRTLAVVAYREPSLVFLLGGDVVRLDAGDAARFLVVNPTALAWVDDSRRVAFETASTREDLHVREIATVDGWNISKGRRVRLHLFERAYAPSRCSATP